MSSSVPSERWRDHFPFPPAFCEVRLYRDHPKTQRSPRRFIGVGGKCLTKTFVCLQREEEGTMDLSYSNLKSSFGFLSLKQNLLFFPLQSIALQLCKAVEVKSLTLCQSEA